MIRTLLILGLATSAVIAEPAPKYVDEAPLPEGWPEPGPYEEVVEKTYPAYRAAFTDKRGETRAFWTLFMHIKKRDIPMTAPVEMPLEAEDERLNESGMAFLYQNQNVGKTGRDGDKIEVKDIPEAKALTFAWQGRDSKENRQKARKAIDRELDDRDLEAAQFRILGYNGPRTPAQKKTWELQAILK